MEDVEDMLLPAAGRGLAHADLCEVCQAEGTTVTSVIEAAKSSNKYDGRQQPLDL